MTEANKVENGVVATAVRNTANRVHSCGTDASAAVPKGGSV
jgi:hypothetical protein